MSFLDKNTPLKVKHVLATLLIVVVLYFGYGLWKQVRQNTVNIITISNFLNQVQQAKKASQSKPAPQVEQERDGTKD